MQLVKAKYRSLRTYYVKECKKIADGTRSGGGASQVYVPCWQYFKELDFLSGTIEICETTSSVMPTTATDATSSVMPTTDATSSVMPTADATSDTSSPAQAEVSEY